MYNTAQPANVPRSTLISPRTALGTVFAALLAFCLVARAEDVDDQYVHVLTTMQQGDIMKTAGNNDVALAKYREAQKALQAFRKDHPDWNPKIVAFRANVIAEKIAALTGETSGATNMPASTETRPSSTAPKTATATGGHTIKLLEAGAEPRKVLRLHPKPGDKQTVQLTVKRTTETKMGQMQVPSGNIPTMTLTIETTIKDLSAKGAINYEMTFGEVKLADDAQANPQVLAAIKTRLDAIKGKTVGGTVSDRGVNEKSAAKASSSADDEITGSFSDLTSAELPEEAVGVGAKWEVREPSKSKGLSMNEITTYQLVSVEGERVTAKGTITQSAGKQKIPNPMIPGANVDLNKYSGKGTAEFTFDLAQLLPSTGKMDMHTESVISANLGGQNQILSVKDDTNIQVESK